MEKNICGNSSGWLVLFFKKFLNAQRMSIKIIKLILFVVS